MRKEKIDVIQLVYCTVLYCIVKYKHQKSEGGEAHHSRHTSQKTKKKRKNPIENFFCLGLRGLLLLLLLRFSSWMTNSAAIRVTFRVLGGAVESHFCNRHDLCPLSLSLSLSLSLYINHCSIVVYRSTLFIYKLLFFRQRSLMPITTFADAYTTIHASRPTIPALSI